MYLTCLGNVINVLSISDSSRVFKKKLRWRPRNYRNQTLCIWLIVCTKPVQSKKKLTNYVEIASSDWSYS